MNRAGGLLGLRQSQLLFEPSQEACSLEVESCTWGDVGEWWVGTSAFDSGPEMGESCEVRSRRWRGPHHVVAVAVAVRLQIQMPAQLNCLVTYYQIGIWVVSRSILVVDSQ